jgi:DNA-binding response OmpR family regulator
VVVDPASRSVWRAGREVRVTAKEFRLLHALLAEPGRVVPKAELLRRVWGYADGTATRTLTVHVSTLRRKLAAAAATADASIVTVGRSGYAFRA